MGLLRWFAEARDELLGRGFGLQGRWGCGRLVRHGGIHIDGEEFLAGVVEGQVLRRLEEPKFADLLGGDATGGEVGDRAGGELEAHVGYVDLAAEDGKTDGADLTNGGLGHGEQDVEVVDHEVQNDVYVE